MEKSPDEDEPDEYVGPTHSAAADELIVRSIKAALLPKPADDQC